MGKYYGIVWSYGAQDSLVHYGIKGQRWGIRRYQNEDGSLTDAGRKRYGYTLEEIDKKLTDAKKKAKALRLRSDDLNSRTGLKAVFTTNDIKNSRAKKKAVKAEKEVAEIESVYDNLKKHDDQMKSEEAQNDKNQTDVMMFEQKDGSGRAMEYTKFNDKVDKKIRDEFGSDKAIKQTNDQMKQVFLSLGFDLNKAFGNGGINKNAFSNKSEAEQLYIMFRLGESLGLIEIPDGLFD